MDPQLTSLIVSVAETANIEQTLTRLVAETGATYCLLLDKSGQIIAAQGDVARQDITALGALLAGAFASSREVARLLHEKDFRSTFQEGTRENYFAVLVQDQWILVAFFDRRTQVGLVKIISKRATEELTSVLERVKVESRAKDSVISTSFRTSVEDTIELLFKD